MSRRLRIEGQDALRRALEARGWKAGAAADAFDLAWLAHVPSRGWRRGLAPHQRVNALPGLGRLLDPDTRRGLLDALARRAPRVSALALPDPLFLLPAERRAFDVAAGDADEILLLRRADSAFEPRWRIVPRAALEPGVVGAARPLARASGDRLVESRVLVTGALPLEACVLGALRASALPDEAPAAGALDPWRAPGEVAAQIGASLRALLASVREELLPAREGDVAIVAFEWHVREDGQVAWIDARLDPFLDDVAAEVAARLDGEAGPPDAFAPLWPAAEATALALLPAPRGEDAAAAGVALPASLADVPWSCAPCDVGSLDDLPVLHDAAGERVLPLDAIGAFVWLGCREGATPATLVQELDAAFDAPREVLEADVWRLLAAWAHAGLVRHPRDLAPAPAPPAPAAEDAAARDALGLRIGTAGWSLRGPASLRAALGTPAARPHGPEEDTLRVAVRRAGDGRWCLGPEAGGDAVPHANWLADDLHAQLALEAAWPDEAACALRGTALACAGGASLLLGPRDLLAHATALLAAQDVPVLAAPFVPLQADGRLARGLAGVVAVPARGAAGALARLPAWRDAPVRPRPVGAPVRLLALPTAPVPSPRDVVSVVVLALDAKGEGTPQPLAATRALELAVRHGMPPGRRLGAGQARAIVACVDRTVRRRVRVRHAAEAATALASLRGATR